MVYGHGQRPNLESGHIIVANLLKTLEANPGSLSNIMAVDTLLTPAPGKGIRFPAGSYELTSAGEKARGSVESIINNMIYPKDEFGFSQPRPAGDAYPIIPGGSHGSSSSTWSAYINKLAAFFDVQSARHFDIGSHRVFKDLKDFEIYNFGLNHFHNIFIL